MRSPMLACRYKGRYRQAGSNRQHEHSEMPAPACNPCRTKPDSNTLCEFKSWKSCACAATAAAACGAAGTLTMVSCTSESDRKMFSALMSLCTTPCSCRYASASAMLRHHLQEGGGTSWRETAAQKVGRGCETVIMWWRRVYHLQGAYKAV